MSVNPYGLTQYQVNIVRYLANGYTPGEISKLINVSGTTLTKHRQAIHKQVGVRNDLELVSKWIREVERAELIIAIWADVNERSQRMPTPKARALVQLLASLIRQKYLRPDADS